MRRPTLAAMAAVVLACGGASTSPSTGDAGDGDGNASSSSGSGSSGSSGSSSSGSGGSSGADAGYDGAPPGPGCPANPPMTGTPCTPTDAGPCQYSHGMFGETCSCDNGGDAGFTWSCAFAGGRRPEGFAQSSSPAHASAFAKYFATGARLEAASVDAFRILRRELAAHGAPRKLLRKASRASRDERRHARVMRSLGRRWGAPVETPRTATRPVRDLFALALENAVEGCVRETYGALLATWQAAHARDREVRAAMSEIAREETQHASLSWEVGRWAEARLGADTRAHVVEARTRAVDALAAELAVDPPAELVERLGVPTAAQAGRLLTQMVRSLRVASA